MNTAEKIRLPDDCTIGYIIESVLGVPLTRSNFFHSHLENLQQVSRSELHKQVRCERVSVRRFTENRVSAFIRIYWVGVLISFLSLLIPDHIELWNV